MRIDEVENHLLDSQQAAAFLNVNVEERCVQGLVERRALVRLSEAGSTTTDVDRRWYLRPTFDQEAVERALGLATKGAARKARRVREQRLREAAADALVVHLAANNARPEHHTTTYYRNGRVRASVIAAQEKARRRVS